MVDITYNGTVYKLVLNIDVFNCINTLFAGYLFIAGKKYRKYMNCNKQIYLVEC